MEAILWGLYIAVAYLCYIYIFTGREKGESPRWSFLVPGVLVVAAFQWLFMVGVEVSEPYLDEVFHIPQAQKYCEGKFLEWDDKITTPPGLYLMSLITPGVLPKCGVVELRIVNTFGVIILAMLAHLCRNEIEDRLHEAHSTAKPKRFTQHAIHSAANIGLFPLLFFFSGLYYTDVYSTVMVLAAYLNHLRRLSRDQSSVFSDLGVIVLGVLTLFMRQTNVFWVVVYMGGVEAVHAIKTLRPERVDQPFLFSLSDQMKYYAWRYSIGDIHDPPLHMMWPDDMVFCVLSLGIAALCNPVRVIRQTWPYIAVFASFGSFVAWNSGVVLGDKSNHVATIHLAQMLYIWPLFAFFSWPLLLPYALSLIGVVVRLFDTPKTDSKKPILKQGKPSSPSSKSSLDVKQPSSGSAPSEAQPLVEDSPPTVSRALSLVSLFFGSRILWPLYLLFTIALSVLVVKYNTIVHPFTLADNRHYMFYIFRYTIRRAAWIRYLLIIPYTVSRYLTWGTMAGCSEWMGTWQDGECSMYYHRARRAPYLSHPFWTRHGGKTRQTSAEFPRRVQDVPSEAQRVQQEEFDRNLAKDPLALSSEPASTSTGLIFLLATSLSLITAPLVEPRYFIIPWVMWRLLVPAWRLHDHDGPMSSSVVPKLSQYPYIGRLVQTFKAYDLRLVIETMWFLVINLVTGYIFLNKPYLWTSEDGKILDGGRLQRFMW